MFIFVSYNEAKVIEVSPDSSIGIILSEFGLKRDSDDDKYYKYSKKHKNTEKYFKKRISIYYKHELLSFDKTFNF